jgi:hypothetical protein
LINGRLNSNRQKLEEKIGAWVLRLDREGCCRLIVGCQSGTSPYTF